jgi:hypothetical protein
MSKQGFAVERKKQAESVGLADGIGSNNGNQIVQEPFISYKFSVQPPIEQGRTFFRNFVEPSLFTAITNRTKFKWGDASGLFTVDVVDRYRDFTTQADFYTIAVMSEAGRIITDRRFSEFWVLGVQLGALPVTKPAVASLPPRQVCGNPDTPSFTETRQEDLRSFLISAFSAVHSAWSSAIKAAGQEDEMPCQLADTPKAASCMGCPVQIGNGCFDADLYIVDDETHSCKSPRTRSIGCNNSASNARRLRRDCEEASMHLFAFSGVLTHSM